MGCSTSVAAQLTKQKSDDSSAAELVTANVTPIELAVPHTKAVTTPPLTRTVDMKAPGGGRQNVPVTGASVDLVLEAQIFKDWFNGVERDSQLFITSIHIQSVDMFGSRVGFIKFESAARVATGDPSGDTIQIPGIVFMRGSSVGVLIILECEGKEYTILTYQARVPVAHHNLPEIPAGTWRWTLPPPHGA